MANKCVKCKELKLDLKTAKEISMRRFKESLEVGARLRGFKKEFLCLYVALLLERDCVADRLEDYYDRILKDDKDKYM